MLTRRAREWLDSSAARRFGALAASVALGAVFAIGAVSYVVIHTLLERHERDDLHAELRLAAQRLTLDLGVVAQDMANLARNSLVSNALVDSEGRDAYLVPFLREHRVKADLPARLSLHDFRGQTVASGGAVPDLLQPQTELVRRSIEGGRPVAGLRGAGHRTLELIYPVAFPTTGTVEGAIVLELDLQRLAAASTGKLGDGLALRLLDGNGLEIAATGEITKQMIYAQARLAAPPPLDSLGLSIRLGLDQSHAVDSLRKLALGYAAVGLVTAVLVVVAALALARRATARLSALSATAERVAQAGLDGVEVSVEGRDEIARLALAFNRMLGRLHESQRSLEGLVEERTASLAQVRDRLASVLHSVRDVIWAMSLDRRGFHYVSPAAGELLGVEAGVLMARPALRDAFILPEDRQTVHEGLQRAVAEGAAAYSYRVAREGRDVRWLEERAYLVRDETGRPVRIDGITSDVTARVQAEQSLRLRERALASSSNGILIADMTAPGEPVLYVNEAFERITGYPASEVLGRNCRFLHGGDLAQPGLQELREAIAARRPCKVILRNYRKDGSLFLNELAISPVPDAQGRITHYVGVQSDVTARVASEAALRERTFRLDAIFALSPDGFVGFDGVGRLIYLNPAFTAMTGLGEGDLLGLDMQSFDARLRALCDRGESYDALTDEGGGDRGAAVLTLARPQRRILTRRLARGAGATGTVLHFRDITRETEVERMKSEFLSTAAHELRTPMSSIYGFSELLVKRDFDEATRRDVAATIHRQAGQLVHMVNELLDLARIESRAGRDFHMGPQPLRPLLESTLQALLVPNDARVVRAEIPDEVPWVVVDGAKLQQALTNLLSNAYKYSPGGGDIVLSVAAREDDGRSWVGVTVRDRGIGMTPEQLRRAFERFYRADPSGRIPGSGLGLSLVKEITELHGGRVEIRSSPGEGTAATLWLPTVEPAAQEGAQAVA